MSTRRLSPPVFDSFSKCRSGNVIERAAPGRQLASVTVVVDQTPARQGQRYSPRVDQGDRLAPRLRRLDYCNQGRNDLLARTCPAAAFLRGERVCPRHAPSLPPRRPCRPGWIPTLVPPDEIQAGYCKRLPATGTSHRLAMVALAIVEFLRLEVGAAVHLRASRLSDALVPHRSRSGRVLRRRFRLRAVRARAEGPLFVNEAPSLTTWGSHSQCSSSTTSRTRSMRNASSSGRTSSSRARVRHNRHAVAPHKAA